MIPECYVMAGGRGLTTGILNTIEKKVTSEDILNGIGKRHIHYQKILNDGVESYSVWGYSDREVKMKNHLPKNGDLVFITNKNAAIYFGEVFLCFYASELDFIWSGRRGWPYKVLLKDVFQVFFPDPKNSAGKDFEKLLELNSFSPSVSSIPNIERQYNQGVGFRNIIGNNNTANFQGSSPINISKNQLLKNLEMYMIKIHFEGIRKIG